MRFPKNEVGHLALGDASEQVGATVGDCGVDGDLGKVTQYTEVIVLVAVLTKFSADILHV